MSTLPETRPTWADVDTAAFSENIDTVRGFLPDGAALVAVLKANGYGHDAVALARRCDPERVAMIATALLEESLELRAAGITLPLLVLGPLGVSAVRAAAEAAITIGVIGPEELEAACEVARERDLTVHLKLDSGMGRMGFVESELPRAVALIHSTIRSTPRLKIGGIYTHLANADDESDPFTVEQIAKYDRMLAELREAGIDAPRHHFANSAATLRRLVRPGDFARVGIALYGPDARVTRPVLRWRTEIARLKTLPAGHAVGYGTTFRTRRESRIATLPVGYADGYSRLLSNNADVLLRGKRAPVVGRVSMDLVTIDVTDLPAAVGDEVVLLGSQGDETITAEELASRTNTISFEVFCRISARVPRRITA